MKLRKPRTLANLKADPRVAHIEHEGAESGVWCAELAPGWVFDREVEFGRGGGNFEVSSGFLARFGIKF